MGGAAVVLMYACFAKSLNRIERLVFLVVYVIHLARSQV